MKKHYAGLAAILFSLVAFGKADADIEFNGVLDPDFTATRIDSVKLASPGMRFLTPDWGSDSLTTDLDTFVFVGVTAWPETVRLYGNGGYFPFLARISRPDPSSWYTLWIGLVVAKVKFYGDYGGIEESRPVVASLPSLAVSPSIVTEQMTVRLQHAGCGRQVVVIHDAAGNVVRSLDCTAGTDGVAKATWNREDDGGRQVPEGVYFCRYASADVIAVRKVLVAR